MQPRSGFAALPKHPTRNALKLARKQAQVPHPSYDLDGDRVVGQRDYFIAKMFDRDGKHGLSAEEREQAEQRVNLTKEKKEELAAAESLTQRELQRQQKEVGNGGPFRKKCKPAEKS